MMDGRKGINRAAWLTPMTAVPGVQQVEFIYHKKYMVYIQQSQIGDLEIISGSRHDSRGPDSSLIRELIFI